MATDPIRQQPAEVNKIIPIGTGTEKIVQDHLKDPNHIITDDHIRNVVVGMSDYVSTGKEEINATNDESDIPTDFESHNEANKHLPPNPWAIAQ